MRYSKPINFEESELNQQAFARMREEKLVYLKKMSLFLWFSHRIVLELQKKKIIDENQRTKDMIQKAADEHQVLSRVYTEIFNPHLETLFLQCQKTRAQRLETLNGQNKLVKKLVRLGKKEKEMKIENLKAYWQREKYIFQSLVQDSGALEQEIMAMYSK